MLCRKECIEDLVQFGLRQAFASHRGGCWRRRGASRVYACDSKPNGTFAIASVYPNDVKSGALIGNYKVLVGKCEQYESDSDGLGPEEVLELQLIEQEIDDSPVPNSLISRTFNNSSTTRLKLEVKEGKYEEWRRRYKEAKKDGTPDQAELAITHSTTLPLQDVQDGVREVYFYRSPERCLRTRRNKRINT